MGKKISLWIMIGLLALVGSGCSASADARPEANLEDQRLQVVATTSIVADLVTTVGGDRVEVHALMGPGIDPHLYKASAGDVRALGNADIVFYNGLHLEAGMATVLERMDEQRQTVAVTRDIDPGILRAPPEFAGNYDPHVWFDVSLWMTTVGTVRDALTAADPEGAETYASQADAYLEELAGLHTYVQEQADRVPSEKRVLVTAHDAFGYFGRAYGFEVIGLQGISTASEIGAGDVQELAAFIAERQIPAIFVESSVPQRNIEAVQAAVRSQGVEVAIGGQLFSDALGSPSTPAESYTGMVRHNVDTIVAGLMGE